MNTLQESYQEVIDHLAADIETLQEGGQIDDAVSLNLLQERLDWLVCRMDRLDEQRNRIISGFKRRLDDYLYQCECFWKSKHTRTYEKRMQELHETKRRVAKIYSLSGYDACYSLLLTLKHLRAILPLPQYAEHAPALKALEAIKADCQQQLGTYLKIS